MLEIISLIRCLIIPHLSHANNPITLNIKDNAYGYIKCNNIILWVVICHVHTNKESKANPQNELYDIGYCCILITGCMLIINNAIL